MNFVLTLLGLLIRSIGALCSAFSWFLSIEKRRCVPALTDDLLKISATDLARLIRNKKVSSEDVIRAYINRIKQVNHMINAVVEERFEDALKDAKSVDDYINTTSLTEEELEKIKPLLGVPLTVKESCSLAGYSFAVGTVKRRGIKADTDGEAVARMKSSGAIPLLVSNTPELCCSWESRNFITGVTNNPYDTSRTSGGSSGGEAALLGSGASLIGIGSDLCGSIRLPSAFCGVFGHKPTPRLTPIKGHYPHPTDEKLPDYCVVGPMVRYAKDLKLMTKIMCGNKKAVDIGLSDKVDLSSLKVFCMEDAGYAVALVPMPSEVKSYLKKSVQYLNENFKSQVNTDFKFVDLADSIEFPSSIISRIEDPPDVLKGCEESLAVEMIKSIFGQSDYTFNLLVFWTLMMGFQYLHEEDHYKINSRLRHLFIDKLGSNGIFLYPSVPMVACKHSWMTLNLYGLSYMSIFNTLGLPATHVPCGLNSEGLPIGIQVVAAPFQDRLCFAVAEELEKCFGGWRPPQ